MNLSNILILCKIIKTVIRIRRYAKRSILKMSIIRTVQFTPLLLVATFIHDSLSPLVCFLQQFQYISTLHPVIRNVITYWNFFSPNQYGAQKLCIYSAAQLALCSWKLWIKCCFLQCLSISLGFEKKSVFFFYV